MSENMEKSGRELPENEELEEPVREVYEGSPAMTVLGALLGSAIGTIPLVLWTDYSGYTPRWLYALIPICAGLAIMLLRGRRGRLGVSLTAVFGCVCGFWAAVMCGGTGELARYELSPFAAYITSFERLGSGQALSNISLPSEYVFPVIFIAIGIFIAYAMFTSKKNSDKSENNLEKEN